MSTVWHMDTDTRWLFSDVIEKLSERANEWHSCCIADSHHVIGSLGSEIYWFISMRSIYFRCVNLCIRVPCACVTTCLDICSRVIDIHVFRHVQIYMSSGMCRYTGLQACAIKTVCMEWTCTFSVNPDTCIIWHNSPRGHGCLILCQCNEYARPRQSLF